MAKEYQVGYRKPPKATRFQTGQSDNPKGRPKGSSNLASDLSAELGARIVRDAQTLNNALGYEMNTIEFAVQDGVPYAIDFLNPAPDFERDRISFLGEVKDGKQVITETLPKLKK